MKGQKVDISEIEIIAEINWKSEDQLPDWVDDEIYKVLYPTSKLLEGIRIFPFITICGKEIALKDSQDYFFSNLLARVKHVNSILSEHFESITTQKELSSNP